MSDRRNALLTQLGFRFGTNGPHAARTMMLDDLSVLRHNKKPKLNITWDKNRGKDVESAPWFKVHKGERINDHHLSLSEKQDAQITAGRS